MASNGVTAERLKRPTTYKGNKTVPDDLRVILYRVVSNIIGTDLSDKAPFDESDNIDAYEVLVKRAGEDHFLDITYIPEDGDPQQKHREFITETLEAEEYEMYLFELKRKITTYVYGDILGRYIQHQPVVCIKGIMALVKAGAEWIRNSTTLQDDIKISWCEAILNSVHEAMQLFEKHTKKSLKCFVDIWEMGYHSLTAGTEYLDPLPITQPLRHDIAAEGADLVRDMIEKQVNKAFMLPLVSYNIQQHRRSSKRLIAKLLKLGQKGNPITVSGEVVKSLADCYRRYVLSSDERKLEQFVKEFSGILLFKILNQFEQRYDSLAALFMAITGFIDGYTQHQMPTEVLCGVVQAAQFALQKAESYIVLNFDPNVWARFEDVMGASFGEKCEHFTPASAALV